MKNRKGDSLENSPLLGCACFAEKRETAPSKISDNGKAPQIVPALMPGSQLFEFTVQTGSDQAVFIDPTFTGNKFSAQTSARAPPRL